MMRSQSSEDYNQA